MSSELTCQQMKELAPELALGIATGEERAGALAHVAGCIRCRSFLNELSEVADELLLAGPTHEPPVGFESRVLARMGIGGPRRSTRLRNVIAAAAVIALAAAIAAGGVFLATGDERHVAAEYRETLRKADGEYFDASHLRDARGGMVGHVFIYEGSTSWIYVTLVHARSDSYAVDLVMTDGGRERLGWMRARRGRGGWGSVVTADMEDVEAIRMVGRHGRRVLEAPVEVAHEGA